MEEFLHALLLKLGTLGYVDGLKTTNVSSLCLLLLLVAFKVRGQWHSNPAACSRLFSPPPPPPSPEVPSTSYWDQARSIFLQRARSLVKVSQDRWITRQPSLSYVPGKLWYAHTHTDTAVLVDRRRDLLRHRGYAPPQCPPPDRRHRRACARGAQALSQELQP